MSINYIKETLILCVIMTGIVTGVYFNGLNLLSTVWEMGGLTPDSAATSTTQIS